MSDRFLVRLRGREGLTVYYAPSWTDLSFYNRGPRELYAVVPVDLAAQPESLRWPDQLGFLFRPLGQKGPINAYYPTPGGSSGVVTDVNPEGRIVGEIGQQLEHVGFTAVGDGYYERASQEPKPEYRQKLVGKGRRGLRHSRLCRVSTGRAENASRRRGLLAVKTTFERALFLTARGAYQVDSVHPYFIESWPGNRRFGLIANFDASWKPFHWSSPRIASYRDPMKADDPMVSSTLAGRFGKWQAAISSDGSLTVTVDVDAGNERVVEMLLTASRGEHVNEGELTRSDSTTGTKLVLSVRENPKKPGVGYLLFLSTLCEVLGDGSESGSGSNGSTVPSIESAGRKVAPTTGVFGERTVGAISREEMGNVALPTAALYAALAMTLTGARDNTRAEIAHAMGVSQITEGEWLSGNRWLRERLGDGSGLTMSNSVWVNNADGKGLEANYINQVKATFAAPATSLPFNEDARSQINSLVHANTGGRIKEFLPQLEASQVFLLLSAMRFQGKWKNAFDKSLTRERNFHGAGQVMMMQKKLSREEGILGFDDGLHFGARLPLADSRYVIDLYSTNNPAGAEDFLKSLDGNLLTQLARQMKPMGDEDGKLLLPRLKVNWKADLIPVLSAMGVKDLFSSRQSNLTGMSSGNLFVDLVLAAGELEWDEIGVEAAGAASVGGSRGLSNDLNFDRPFVVDIRRTDNGASVFHAAVRKP